MAFQDTMQAISELTDINAHTQAYVLGCEYLESRGCHLDDVITGLNNIINTQSRLGYLPNDLMEKRHRYYNIMMNASKEALTEDEQKVFYSCF